MADYLSIVVQKTFPVNRKEEFERRGGSMVTVQVTCVVSPLQDIHGQV